MSQEKRFRFDSITMIGVSGDGSIVSPPLVAFDKKQLYIGNGNWTIKFKELNRVNVAEESARRGRGGLSRTKLTLSDSRGKAFACITSAADSPSFHSFAESLKQTHRKAKIKNNEKDPYAAASGNNAVKRTDKNGSNRLPWITPSFPRAQRQQQSRSSLHLTPTKMKQSSGVYLSSSRRNFTAAAAMRGNNVPSSSSPISSLNLPPKSPRNTTPTKLGRNNLHHDEHDYNDYHIHDVFEFTDDNHNAATTSHDNTRDDDNNNIKKRSSSSRVLFHDSVTNHDAKQRRGKTVLNKKLMNLIEDNMMKELSDDDDDEEEEEEEEDVNRKVVEKEEKSVVKKKRLRKLSSSSAAGGRRRKYDNRGDDDDDASDAFDDDIELDDTTTATTISKWKKKKYEEDNKGDDDDDEDYDEKDSPSPVKKEQVKKNHGGKTITDDDTSRETSPVTTDDVVADDKEEETGERGGSGGMSTSAVKSSSSIITAAAKKGSGTIHTFFQPRSARSAVPPILVKKKKKKKIEEEEEEEEEEEKNNTPLLLTPSRPMKSSPSSTHAETTPPQPIQNQRQSRFFSNLDKESSSSAPKKKKFKSNYSDSPSDTDYVTEEEHDDEDDIYAFHDEENATSPMMNEFRGKVLPRVNKLASRNIYGSRQPRQHPTWLGRSRLSTRNHFWDVHRRGVAQPSEADTALGRTNLLGRTKNRDLSRRGLWKDRPVMIEDHQDDIDDKEKEDDKPKIPGIQNLGNTCYLSASLQTLFSIPQFLHNLYRSYEELVSTKEMPLTKALLEVATAIQVLKEADVPRISPEVARNKLFNSKAANPSALKKQMDVLTDKFTGYEQRDAHEFLGDLVDFLHDELADSPSDGNEDGEMKKLEESNYVDDDDVAGKSAPAAAVATTSPLLPTDEYFHLKVRVCLECKSCGYSRSKDELYRHLSVDVGEDTDGETWSVERSLQQFFQNEDREVKCEECESGTSATQTMEIISRPKALLLHFKRFIVTQKENAEMVLRKNKAKISLEDSLSISSFFNPEQEKPNGLYHLCGVVHHVGNTAFSGHYTTCAKRKLDEQSAEPSQNVEEQWVFFDDTVGERRTISYVTGNEINQKNCYMALYELK